MKQFIAVFVCALVATALASPAADYEKVKESVRKIKQAHETCNADLATHLDTDDLKKKHEPGYEPANLPAHTLCVSKNLGWQNADGSVNADLIRSRATAIFGENAKLDQIIAECVQPQATPEATAKHLFDCYRKNSPRPSGTRPAHH